MVECASRCFVRVCHNKIECRRTAHPYVVVTYRLAFESFPEVDNDTYDLVYYNGYAQERVPRVGVSNRQLLLTIGSEHFLSRRSLSAVQLVELDVRSSQHHITAVTVSVAFALRPEEMFRGLPENWSGRSLERIRRAFIIRDNLPPKVLLQVVVEFKE